MLHIFTRSPFQSQAFSEAAAMINKNDSILLIQDAVIAATVENSPIFQFHEAGVKIYLLSEDIVARGLRGKLKVDVDVVDYKGFVGLTVDNDTQVKWA
ncbi:sulfurtransferase complex subunit TusB [Photobacterium sp. ZSDE20]|uniref:Sulfurtransferase complex subunit TusB n=1 Tax=Photobacterium pectinilyticum TaxID=2906793 RepID=A0ABT1MWG3_9GAMM|nr:sulfurtransferase complex subunit TusB [Photobacterium sp. ZSDE20]MCQ1056828.1 sulfurtransferase complex subunit TusB [Photobacterium sp. ZSDE20]